MSWTPGDVSGSQTLTTSDHLYAQQINEVRTALDTLNALGLVSNTQLAHLAGGEIFTGAKTFNAGAFLDKGNHVYNVKAYGAVADALSVTDGAITSGAAILTSATGSFTSGDVGKSITVRGAGSSGSQLNLFTTIAGYTSATQVTLTANASHTVSGASVAWGTDNHTAFQNAVNAATGGGIIFIPPGKYYLSQKTSLKYDGIKVIGAGRAATVLVSGYDVANAGLLDFSDPGSSINYTAGEVHDISFDLNGTANAAVSIRAVGSGKTYKGFLLRSLEIYNRAPDNSGAIGCIFLGGTYPSSLMGALSNVTIEGVEIHDGLATSTSYTSAQSICILSQDMVGLTIKGCYFHDIYGSTIVHNNGSGSPNPKDWLIQSNRFINTVRTNPGGGAQADFINVTRDGYTGLKVLDNYFEQVDGLTTDDRYVLAVYKTTGFIVSGNHFLKNRAIMAPGHSFPYTNESMVWTFSNNTLKDVDALEDPDGHFVGTYSGNILYNVAATFGFGGGYGRMYPTVVQNNLYVNSPSNPGTSSEWVQSNFISEDGGLVYQNNVVYYDPAMTAPGAPTVADSGVAGNLNGTYTYKITFLGSYSETEAGTISASVTVTNKKVSLTNIPLGPSGCTARRLWRTPGTGGSTHSYVVVIEDNTTTTYTDNITDASLGGRYGNAPSTNNTDSHVKYTFFENTGNPQNPNPNIYKGNVVYGATATSKTFALDSAIPHVIMSNFGVTESTIQNSYAHGSVSVTSLAAADVVTGNFTSTGDSVQLYYDQGNVTGAITFSPSNGSVIRAVATGNITTTISNGGKKGQLFTLRIVQDNTGGRTISKPANVKLVGAAFSPSAGANTEDSWTFEWDGNSSKWIEVSRALNVS